MQTRKSTIPGLLERLKHSSFRSRFTLKEKDIAYIRQKGIAVVMQHAREILVKRILPPSLPNDGRQTPMSGHPVFVAQHATALCCRKCLEKWHHIPHDKPLTEEELMYLLQVINAWLQQEIEQAGNVSAEPHLQQLELL